MRYFTDNRQILKFVYAVLKRVKFHFLGLLRKSCTYFLQGDDIYVCWPPLVKVIWTAPSKHFGIYKMALMKKKCHLYTSKEFFFFYNFWVFLLSHTELLIRDNSLMLKKAVKTIFVEWLMKFFRNYLTYSHWEKTGI